MVSVGGELDAIVDGLSLPVELDVGSMEAQPKIVFAEAQARAHTPPYLKLTITADIGDFVERSTARKRREKLDTLDQIRLARTVPAEEDRQGLEQVKLRPREILEIRKAMHDECCAARV